MNDVALDAAKAQGTDSWALFLDFDGTLVDIVERPDAVVVEPGLPGLLHHLRGRLGGALALISGRPIAFLDERLAPYRFDAAGLHGIEHRMSGRLSPCRPKDHPALQAAIARLKEIVAPHPGLIVEDKGCSVALHWRLAPHDADFARATMQAMEEALGPDYRIQFGKAVAEILPAASGKGRVIGRSCNRRPIGDGGRSSSATTSRTSMASRPSMPAAAGRSGSGPARRRRIRGSRRRPP